MALLIEAICVVIRCDAIKRKFAGGFDGFMRTLPNETLCVDESLARIAFMAPREASGYIAHLERSGLRLVKEDKSFDIVIVDQTMGPTSECDWLEFARVPYKGEDGETVGTIATVTYKGLPGQHRGQNETQAGTEPSPLVTHPNWKFAGSLSEKCVTVPQGQVTDRMKYLRSEGSMSIFLDTQSGEEVAIFHGRQPQE